MAHVKPFIQQILPEPFLGAKHCSGGLDINKKSVAPSLPLTFSWKAGTDSKQGKYMNKIISDGTKCSEENKMVI